MPRTRCCAPNCTTTGGFRFPTDVETSKLWQEKIQRKDWTPTENSLLCSDHFDISDIRLTTYTGWRAVRRHLKKGAVPKYFGNLANRPHQSATSVTSTTVTGDTQASLSAGTNTDCRQSTGTSILRQRLTNHRQVNLESSEQSVVRHEDMGPQELLAIKKEFMWDRDEVADAAPPQPMLEINVKPEPSTIVESYEVNGWAAVQAKQCGDKVFNIKQETEAEEREPMFGFVDVTANLSRLPTLDKISDIDPLETLQGAPVTPIHKPETPTDDWGQLEIHVAAPKGGQPACATCGRAYASAVGLRRHLLLHSAPRSHRCPECGATFARPDYLSKHLSAHANERAHACALCDKTFARSAGLAKHVRGAHSNVRPFACKQCEVSFAHREQLERHLRSMRVAHGIVSSLTSA